MTGQTNQVSKQKPSVLEGIAALQKSSKYQVLPAEKKLAVRGHLFDKYVGPYLKTRGLDPTDKDTRDRWVNAGIKPFKSLGEPTTREKALDLQTHFEASGAKGGVKTMRGLLDLSQSMIHGFSEHLPIKYKVNGVPVEKRLLDKYDAFVDKGHTWLNAREDLANSMLGANYNQGIKTKVVELPGRVMGAIGEHPGFIMATEGVGLAGGLLGGETAITEGLLGGGAKAKYAYRALKGAAEGYLGSRIEGASPEDAKGTAKGFAAFEVALTSIPYLGKLLGIGGPKALKNSIEAVAKSTAEDIDKSSADKISNVIVKATAKNMNEVAQGLGYRNFWDAQNQGKGGDIVAGVMALAKQANREISIHNPDLVAAQAEHDFTELQKNPLGQGFLKILQANGANPVKDTVAHVVQATKAVSGAPLEKSTVGAASAKSLEFSDNLSARIKSNIPFEKRTHKLLAAMSTLFDEAQSKGGKMTKGDNELFNAIQHQLDQDPEFRELTLNQRLEAGANVHKHIDALLKEGTPDAKGIKRFWRSTEVRPGEVPTGFQRQLQAKTGMIEGAPHKIGDYVRIGQTKMLGHIVESDVRHSVIELPSGTKYTVANNEIFSAGAKKTEIAKEFSRRREQATQITAMKEAEEKIVKRQAEKKALEEKQQFKKTTQEVAQTVKEEDPKAYISKQHVNSITQELLYARGLKGEALTTARKKMIHDYFALVKAGAKKEDALNAVKDNKIDELLNRLMKEKTQQISGKDTFKLEDAVKKLFPGKEFGDLTKEQRQEAINLSLGKGKK